MHGMHVGGLRHGIPLGVRGLWGCARCGGTFKLVLPGGTLACTAGAVTRAAVS